MELVDTISKYLKSLYLDTFLLFISLIFIWFIIPKFNYNWGIKFITLDITIKLILSIIAIIIYINNLILKKNKSKLPGIVFCVDKGESEKNDKSSSLFFQTLKNKLDKSFNIVVYDKAKWDVLYKKRNITKLMTKKNILIIFNLMERTGDKNQKSMCELKFLKMFIGLKIPENYLEYLKTDLNRALNQCLEITNENSLNIIDNEVRGLELYLDYFMAMIYILSPTPEKSFKLLDQITNILKKTNTNPKNIKYIAKNITLRYLEAYASTIDYLFYLGDYYQNLTNFQKLKELVPKFAENLEKCQNRINKEDYQALKTIYYGDTAMLLYEENNIDEAVKAIYSCSLKVNKINVLFNRAFLIANQNKYQESLKIYDELSHEESFDIKIINEVIDFIDKRYSKNPENISLTFCYAIVNYYFKDKVLAKKYLSEIKEKDPEISLIYDNLFSK